MAPAAVRLDSVLAALRAQQWEPAGWPSASRVPAAVSASCFGAAVVSAPAAG